MKQEIIQQILEGNFDYENGSLDFSCAKLELTLAAGESREGTFRIFSAPERPTNGYITTSDARMECLTPEFVGSDEEIAFCFHGEHMEEGDVLKGVFNVISNQGEYYLPFLVTVEHTALQSSLGDIKNLFHFANLAKSNWQEAVSLFYSKDFAKIFEGTDEKIYDCYRGLSTQPGNEQNMEEFLIQINKKQKVDYLVEEQELFVEIAVPDGPYAVSEQGITIVRNGWGYTALQVECDGEFLFTEKSFLSDEDFVGNRCRLPIFLDSGHYRPGRNYGQVVLYNSYVYLTVPVVVKVGENGIVGREKLSRKRILVQLMEYYQAFRMKKISSATWIKESSKLVEHLAAVNEQDVEARLYQAQLLISEEKYNEAGWLMDHSADLLEKYYEKDSALWAYYLYLTTLVNREEGYVNQVTDEVDRIYRRDKSQWRVAWLLLYLAEEYNRSASGKWLFLEKQFVNGCISPILYGEAIVLLNNNPALLRKLDSYEQQVLYYGAKNQLLSAELIEQMLYLFGKVREYSNVLFMILQKLYERKPENRILQEICALLIKGNKVGTNYFEWYKKGVEAQLRITNLYEYYCMSLDLNATHTLPKSLLMYFAYQSDLDCDHSAYLYNYVEQHKEELADLYDSYRLRIEHFVKEQLEKQRISRQLAALYQSVITPEYITEENAGSLEYLLFAHRLVVEDERLRKAYVYQPGNLKAMEYTLSDCTAWVALYGNDYTIVFEDAYGNRFIRNVEYTLERLMIPGKFIRQVAAYVQDSVPLDLYLYEADHKEIVPETVDRALRLAASEEIAPEIRKDIYLRALHYYYDSDDMAALDGFLEKFPAEELTMRERRDVVKYMVLREKYDAAYSWVEQYGPYFVDAKTLVRLVSEKMRRMDMLKSDTLLTAAESAFVRGKYNGAVLEYLTRYFEGLTRDMRDIWKAAKSYDVDCFDFTEKMLLQMLYSGSFVGEKMDIFRYYVSQGGRQEVLEAFLRQCCYDYFVRERLTESYVFQQVRLEQQRGEQVTLVCKLAFLKYYAENPEELGEEEVPLIEEYLGEMLRKGIHLNFFRELGGFAHMTHVMDDRTIIEYRARPGARARIHYVMVHENGEADEYRWEYMQEVYPGVFFKEFVLFFGENLQYYIMEEDNGEEQLTESGNIQKSDIVNTSGGNRYDMINDMIISKTLQDYDTLDNLMYEYYRREYLNEALFKLV
ncbi:MAG: hypothetical protein IJ833_09640 [Lachnospiraceae bacterium]|nr:hypothetical protein [Lachnospiraceae bacterium]